MPTALGIDLGTTNTSAALVLAGRVIDLVVGPRARPYVMRSAALRTSGGEWLGGDAALDGAEADPGGLLLEAFKPLLALPERGRTIWRWVEEEGHYRVDHNYDEVMERVNQGWAELYVESKPATSLAPGATLTDVRAATRAVLASVHAKFLAAGLATRADNVVIGVPVSYPIEAREKLLWAAEQAGLAGRGRIALLQEPVAVALAYGVEHRTPKRVLVFDHGGGTLDLAIIDVAGHPDREFRYSVLGQASIPKAGRYYDKLLLAAILREAPRGQEVLAELGKRDPMEIGRARLLDAVENVKIKLCQQGGAAALAFPMKSFFFRHEASAALFGAALSDELRLIADVLQRLIGEVEAKALRPGHAAGPAGVEEVLLAGGSSQIPAIQELVQRLLPGVPMNTKYAGTRTSTRGFAQAVEYRRLIDELTDIRYGVYEPASASVVPVLDFGTPLQEATVAAQTGRESGMYIQAPAGTATVLLFSWEEEQNRLIMQGEVTGADPAGPVQVLVELDPATGRPALHAVACQSGKELPVRVIPAAAASVPILEPGQVLRYRNNGLSGNARQGTGCVSAVKRIRDGSTVAFAVDDMKAYRLDLHQPDGGKVQVWAANPDLESYSVEQMRPGDTRRLDQLEEGRFRRLSAVQMHPFERVLRPALSPPMAPAAPRPDAPKAPPPAPEAAPAPAEAPPERRGFRSFLTSLIQGKPAAEKRVTWREVAAATDVLFAHRRDERALEWAELAWAGLERRELTRYTGPDERAHVLLQLAVLAELHRDFCTVAGRRVAAADHAAWLRAFRLGHAELLAIAGNQREAGAGRRLTDAAAAALPQHLLGPRGPIVAALLKHFGGASVLFALLWATVETKSHVMRRRGWTLTELRADEAAMRRLLGENVEAKFAAFEWVNAGMPPLHGVSHRGEGASSE